MPFDAIPDNEVTLPRLSFILRHPELWPEGFRWDYCDCGMCAMGLAYQLKTGEEFATPRGFDLLFHTRVTRTVRAAVADLKAMSLPAFHRIFWEMETQVNGKVTPEHVADAIDRYLAKRG